jgi:hypothetical protein
MIELLKDTRLNYERSRGNVIPSESLPHIVGSDYVAQQYEPRLDDGRVTYIADTARREVYWRFGGNSEVSVIQRFLDDVGRSPANPVDGRLSETHYEYFLRHLYRFYWVQG